MSRSVRRYLNPYVGGALLGVLLFLTFFITGGGLGASGGINRFQVAVVDLFALPMWTGWGTWPNWAVAAAIP